MGKSLVEVVHCSKFNLTVSSSSDRRVSEPRICIVTIKGKTTEFNHISRSYFVYIMSSCSKYYSIYCGLNMQRGNHRSPTVPSVSPRRFDMKISSTNFILNQGTIKEQVTLGLFESMMLETISRYLKW